MTRHRDIRIAIPPDPGPRSPHPLGISRDLNQQWADPRHLELIWEWIVGHPEIKFHLAGSTLASNSFQISSPGWPSHDLYVLPARNSANFYLLRRDGANGAQTLIGQQRSSADFEDIDQQLSGDFRGRIYRFSAERFGIAESNVGTNRTLATNAANLPEVLNILQSNSFLYEEFISLVREILPQVHWVNVEPIDANMLRINVWNLDRKLKRDDLSIPLSESGTGVGQVLSILYVVFTSEDSRVLLIDEPQSFLHPGAARKLIEVLRRFPQHQYIVSTHSPGIISAADAPEVLIVRNEYGISRIDVVETRDNEEMRVFLDELGTRLSDVFGMDRVVWVEGATEEKALPLLLEKMGFSLLAGTAIVRIRNTGDLEGKDKRKVFEIYNNLASKANILPQFVAFVLDGEARSETEKEDIRKISGGKAWFLPRRTFENYLLDARAVCSIANALGEFSESGPINPEKVAESFANRLNDPKVWVPHPVPESPSLDCPQLNGALLLEKMFSDLSENRFTYRKTEHSVGLFRWLLTNSPGSLDELTKFLSPILGLSD